MGRERGGAGVVVVADEDGQNVAVSAEQGVEAAVVACREAREENQRN